MSAQPKDPMLPRPFRIERVQRELSDTFTMELVPEAGGPFGFKAGQFNMLYVFGVGEVPISISGDPADRSKLVHTTRAVGAVTKALDAMKAGDTLGVRGPYGTAWP
ncbi:MAG TPA: Ni/Fe hydrogenase subunit gamma, partial [Candidatus Omnitrophota bacterium]|nr:Ni/Fe hydrogenase subunit gamma [Candidatus Omnitrophota bacterium]